MLKTTLHADSEALHLPAAPMLNQQSGSANPTMLKRPPCFCVEPAPHSFLIFSKCAILAQM
jgi:hypothetical protein